MSALFSTSGLARACARHPWRVIASWVVVLLLALIAARGLSQALTSKVSFTGTPESREGALLLQSGFGTSDRLTETVVVHSDRLTVDDPAFQQVVQQTTAALRGMSDVVGSAVNLYEARAAGSPQAAALVSADRHTTLIPVTLSGDLNQLKPHADEYLRTVRTQGTNDVDVLTVGALSVYQVSNQAAEHDLRRAEVVTLIPSLLILIAVFGALLAAGIPLVLSAVSILTAIGLTALVGRLMDLSYFIVNMITMVGLAIGIDYTLFIISRYREERRLGLDPDEAMRVTGATASKAALFSGITVCLALSGLLLLPATVLRSLGLGAVLVVLAALAAMLTLVPALIGLSGDRLDWPRRRASAPAGRAGTLAAPTGGFWAGVARVVMGRPVVSLALATLVLVVLAIPVRDLQLGTSGVSTLPPSDLKRAYNLLNQQFSAGLLSPVEIVVDAQRTPATEAALARLTGELRQDPSFLPRAQVRWDAANDLADLTIPLAIPPDSPRAVAAVRQLRHDLIPAAFAGTPARVYVTGATALNLDFQLLVEHYTPYIFAYVLGLSFLLLLLVFRSLVVPVKAILMNLLSVGAAYGLLVLVFQKGHLHNLFGFQQTPTVETWIPIFLFCVLFGLSMDYHVFLLSRIREHFDQSHDNHESVALGLISTARIITGAALIMVVVFAGFAAGSLVLLQQVGFGLAVAVLLDATIVRTVIVPAAMTLLGDANWYLPHWLEWLPDLRIENRPQLAAAGVAAPAGPPPAAELARPARPGPRRERREQPARRPESAGRAALAAPTPIRGVDADGTDYPLLDVVALALAAVIAGADTDAAIADFARSQRDGLATFLELREGVPSQETFSRVLAVLDPAHLEAAFLPGIRALAAAARQHAPMPPGGDPLRRVRVRDCGRHLQFSQRAVDAESALPETLAVLAPGRTVVAIDASAGQRTIARRLVSQGADYVVALNGNAERLTRGITAVFSQAEPGGFTSIAHDYHETESIGPDGTERQRAWLITDPSYLAPLNERAHWPRLNSIGLVEREIAAGGVVSREQRSYLSSLEGEGNARRLAEAVRLRRPEPSELSWLLAIDFGAEMNVPFGHDARNLALLRRLAVRLLREERTARGGLTARRLSARRDERYLLAVLAG
ncbi:MAG TPA: ISAs1 family transposase [Thermomicrobiaceae bacterium]|nr:ISAs1 family transposase [Thermomicrobiaceae bacterium]